MHFSLLSLFILCKHLSFLLHLDHRHLLRDDHLHCDHRQIWSPPSSQIGNFCHQAIDPDSFNCDSTNKWGNIKDGQKKKTRVLRSLVHKMKMMMMMMMMMMMTMIMKRDEGRKRRRGGGNSGPSALLIWRRDESHIKVNILAKNDSKNLSEDEYFSSSLLMPYIMIMQRASSFFSLKENSSQIINFLKVKSCLNDLGSTLSQNIRENDSKRLPSNRPLNLMEFLCVFQKTLVESALSEFLNNRLNNASQFD